MIEIFTDGACQGNPGPGGWGAIIRQDGREQELSGRDGATTNNRMELLAAINALEALPGRSKASLTTDSQYVRQGITSWIHGWKRKGWKTAGGDPVKNRDLWERLDALAGLHTIEWKWIKGHSGHPMNERCDRLAVAAIRGQVVAPAASPAPAAPTDFWDFDVPSEEHIRRVKELLDHCRKFIAIQRITCPDTIYQTDRVIENAPEFIEGVVKIVGFAERGDAGEG